MSHLETVRPRIRIAYRRNVPFPEAEELKYKHFVCYYTGTRNSPAVLPLVRIYATVAILS